MKSLRPGSLRWFSSGHWRVRACQLARSARPSADARRDVEPGGRSFDDSRHPVSAVADRIAIFFLAISAVAFLVLMTDAFLTRA